MANLVRLNLDRDTGRIVAGGTVESGGGSGGPVVTSDGYLFTQGVASDLWTINHFAGTTNLLIQIFDSANNLVIPDNVELVNINTVEVTLSTPITGTARIIFFTV